MKNYEIKQEEKKLLLGDVHYSSSCSKQRKIGFKKLNQMLYEPQKAYNCLVEGNMDPSKAIELVVMGSLDGLLQVAESSQFGLNDLINLISERFGDKNE